MDAKHCSQVMEAIWQQKQERRFCDLILRVNDGAVLAHKCVLCASSPFFESVLSDQATEGITPELHLSGWSVAFIDAVVDYMYSGEVNVGEDIIKFLAFADHYAVAGLKSICIDIAKNTIDIYNWVSLLKLTIANNTVDLRGAIRDFLLKADDAVMLESLDFCQLSYEEIVYTLLFKDERQVTKTEALQQLKLSLRWITFSFSERQQYIVSLIKDIPPQYLNYAATIEVLRTLPDALRAQEDVIELVKTIESNKHELDDEIQSNVDEEFHDESDRESISAVNCAVLKYDSNRQMKNKRSTSVMAASKKSTSAPVPALRFKVRDRPRGRPTSKDNALGPGKIRLRPKLLLGSNKSKRSAEESENTVKKRPSTGKARTPRKKKSDDNQSVPGGQEVFKCPQCAETCSNKIIFRQHMKHHGENSPFSCDMCDFQTKHYGMFLSHKRRKHKQGESMIKCPKCPKTFSCESACSHHLRGHGTEVPLLCDMCGFTTKHHATMNLHKRVHQGRVFKCNYVGCTYTAVRKNRYLDHLSAHEGLKNHICSVCGKSFSARKHLLRHENIHRGTRFECQLCEYRSPRNDKLRQHIKSKHPQEAFQRGYCTQEEAMKQDAVLASSHAKPSKSKPPKSEDVDAQGLRDGDVGEMATGSAAAEDMTMYGMTKQVASKVSKEKLSKPRARQITPQEEVAHATQSIVMASGKDGVYTEDVVSSAENGPIQGTIPVPFNEEMLQYLSANQAAWPYQTN